MGIENKDPALKAIHVSIQFDQRLWREDIAGSLAHVQGLAAAGVVTAEELATLQRGLKQVADELEAGAFEFREDDEDIHLNIERRLTEIVGPVGGKLHTGRSRNDQVATDLRLWCRSQLEQLDQSLSTLLRALVVAARREFDAETVLPFYTHLQRAQPVMLAHHLLAHVEALERDQGRLHDAAQRLSECPLGAGAGAGTGHPIDPNVAGGVLGFARPCRNSLDAVAARDYVIETLAALAMLMTHLSRLSEEFILWSSQEFGFVTLSDKVTTGSSIMPQKRNPDGAELVRGKTGRVIGRLVGLLATLKALPLAYNKDLQEDKESLFDAFDTTRLSVDVTTSMVNEAEFHRDRMRAALETVDGYANATELADYLVRQGMPFREAHGAVRKLVDEARHLGKRLQEMDPARIQAIHPNVGDDVFDALTVESAISRRAALMGTAPERVGEALAEAEKRVSQ